MVKMIDLSVTVSMRGNLKVMPQIVYRKHDETARGSAESMGIKPEDFPEGKYCASETVTLGTHNTTHMDAPYHFYPTSEGKPVKTIDQIPLEWRYGVGWCWIFIIRKKEREFRPKRCRKP